MPWAAVACAVASIAQAQASGPCYTSDSKWTPLEKPLETLEREHRAKVAADLIATQREAKKGAYLLAALIVALAVGAGRLLGIV